MKLSSVMLLLMLTSACADDGSDPGSGGGGASPGSGGQAGFAPTGGAPGSGGAATGGAAGVGSSPSSTGGASGSPTDAGVPGEPPGPTDAGTSVYAVECRGDSVACGDPDRVRCLGVGTMDAPYGFACSNRCETVSDCSTAPVPATAQVDCVALTSARHCLLVCRTEQQELACPAGMGCYVYPGSRLGYCLWQ